MSGIILPIPIYACKARCLIKCQEQYEIRGFHGSKDDHGDLLRYDAKLTCKWVWTFQKQYAPPKCWYPPYKSRQHHDPEDHHGHQKQLYLTISIFRSTRFSVQILQSFFLKWFRKHETESEISKKNKEYNSPLTADRQQSTPGWQNHLMLQEWGSPLSQNPLT
jgi:hypothetical protein